MQYNLSDPAVRTELLQRMLRYLALTGKIDGLLVSVDGVYNEETRQAVRYFQQMKQIPVTGVVDQRTWDEIAEMYAREQALRSPVSIRVMPSAAGEKSDAVLILQVILNALRFRYAYPPVPLTGIYGRETTAAVTEFQRINGLTQDGYADAETWLRLADEYNLLTEQ